MIIVKENCPNCGDVLEIGIDTSEGPSASAGTECNCGAMPTWKVDWVYDVWLGEYIGDDSTAQTNNGLVLTGEAPQPPQD